VERLRGGGAMVRAALIEMNGWTGAYEILSSGGQ
jgi:hypothetical protein